LNRVDSRVGPIALVTIDNGEDHTKPTTLGRSGLASLESLLERLETGDWAAMVVTGKPFVFCVGADIDEFTRMRSTEDALAGTRAGHALFARIHALPFPTVGAVNGACLGGGLELALHCDARTIAANVRHVGFPEVALSIIPGWGGTQLLPELVGPEAAAKVIVLNPLRQNKLLKAEEAFELGIVDMLLDPVEYLDESLTFARDLGKAAVTDVPRERARGAMQRELEPAAERSAVDRGDGRKRQRADAPEQLVPGADPLARVLDVPELVDVGADAEDERLAREDGCFPVAVLQLLEHAVRRVERRAAERRRLAVVLAVVDRDDRGPAGRVQVEDGVAGHYWTFSQRIAQPMPMPMQSAVTP
jgi:enoyl-CoA hydratase/carnithine racemase